MSNIQKIESILYKNGKQFVKSIEINFIGKSPETLLDHVFHI